MPCRSSPTPCVCAGSNCEGGSAIKIGQAATLSGVPAKTIRYYESIGLIAPARRSDSGYRRYERQDIETLRFIRRARRLGFAVPDVAKLLALWRDKARSSSEVKDLANRHLIEIDARIAQLTAMRAALTELVDRCQGDKRPDCPILRDLAEVRTETSG